MKKKILVFDNNIDITDMLCGIIEKCKFEPIACDRIAAANYNWKDNYHSLSAIILDLNMPTDGLEEDLIKSTVGGKLTGWVWYMNNVMKGNYKRSDFINKTLIYSGYLDFLNNDNLSSTEEIEIIKKIEKIEKSDINASEKIEKFLKKI